VCVTSSSFFSNICTYECITYNNTNTYSYSYSYSYLYLYYKMQNFWESSHCHWLVKDKRKLAITVDVDAAWLQCKPADIQRLRGHFIEGMYVELVAACTVCSLTVFSLPTRFLSGSLAGTATLCHTNILTLLICSLLNS
jgi:hypothetical protein